MIEYMKPLPSASVDTKDFWEACKRHELVIQRCKDCGTFRFYPAPLCHKCTSASTEWVRVSGKGNIYSWIVVRAATDPAWANEVPYVVVVVELDEQPRLLMVGNLVGCDPEKVSAGMHVEAIFDDVTPEVTLVKWRPSG